MEDKGVTEILVGQIEIFATNNTALTTTNKYLVGNKKCLHKEVNPLNKNLEEKVEETGDGWKTTYMKDSDDLIKPKELVLASIVRFSIPPTPYPTDPSNITLCDTRISDYIESDI